VNRRKKIVAVIVAVALSVLILLFAVFVIAPKIVDTKIVKGKLRSELKEIAGVEIDFKHLILDFFPHPHVIVKQVEWSIPPGVRGIADSIRMRPKILPLFLGKMQIASLRLDLAELDYTLPEKPATAKTTPPPFSLDNLGKRIQAVVATLPEFKIPDLDFRVNNSRANLFIGDRKFLELTGVNSHLEGPPAERKISISCQSNLWQRISMSGLLNTKTFKGSGQIQFTQFRPQGLVANLFPDTNIRITDGHANLTIDLKTDEPGQLQAELNGSSSSLKFRFAKEALNIENPRFKATVQVDKNSVGLSLAELALDKPKLNLSANLALTQNTPPLSLEVKGSQIDVAATRQMVLALVGKNDDVKDIFDIVKAGSVPEITLKSQGNSLGDLADMNKIVIQGQMQDGEISIPDIQFDLADVAGEVVISRGILEGQNLQARLGNSFAQNGKLKLGLIGNVAPFHLETDLRADLSQLPPILKRLVDDKDFQKELTLLKELKGSANGKLVLGEDTDNLKVKVEASKIQLSAHYGRLPHPLQITRGNFSYDENRFGVTQLSGKLGKTSFSDLSGGLGLGKGQDLAITSGKSGLHLPEIVPWLASFEEMRDISKYYGGGKGIITLSKVNVKGPLSSPSKWHFNVSGDVKDLVLKNLPGRPGPLKIASAKFSADPHTLGYTDGQMSLLDSVWKISGTHKDFFKGLDKDVSLKFEARLGSKSVLWFSKSFDVPDEIHIRPLTLSTSHINYVNYVRNGEKTISANLAIQGGLKISTDLVLGSDKLVVKKLFIQDKASRATMGISLYNDIITLSFKGNLHKTTLDRLTTENPWLAGWLEGDFNAHINMEHPLKSAAWGELKGKELIYPWKPDTPLKINDFAATADTHKIDLQSADVTFSGSRLQAAGNMTRSAQKVLVDMDITADTVDLDPLIQALKNRSQINGGGKTPKSQAIPVKGNIRFKADRFKIGKFSWNPLHADIRLDNDTADVTLKKAVLCGISTPGTLKVSPPNIDFDLEAVAKDQKLDPAKTCLVGETFKADGTYNLKGRFQGRGKAEDLLKTATGQVEFRAADGHIYHDVILLEVLKFLNTLEMLDGRVNEKDMKKKGFGYHSFGVKAKLQDGKLRYDEAVLHGRPMTVTAAGEHNLQTGRFDLTLLVASLVTLDRIFEHIPLIGGILEALDTIPLSAKGTLENIHVYPLAPSAVAYELAEMMKKTVKRPINLIHGGEKTEDR
jgi:hypothetical protein